MKNKRDFRRACYYSKCQFSEQNDVNYKNCGRFNSQSKRRFVVSEVGDKTCPLLKHAASHPPSASLSVRWKKENVDPLVNIFLLHPFNPKPRISNLLT